MKNIKITLTPRELLETLSCVRTHIIWDVDGKYGDGDTITDKSGLRTAKVLLKKLEREYNALLGYDL